MDPLWEIATIEEAAARISMLARDSDLSDPVPHLNRWKVRDVVAHLGGVHRWATRIVQERSTAGPGFTKSKLHGVELCDWFDEGTAALLAELRATGSDEPCPNFNPGSQRVVGFWARRQAHETTVHRWDVEKALGCTTSIDPKIAADGIDEFLDVFVRTRGKQTLSSTLVLRTKRPVRSWTLTPAAKTGRIDVSTDGPHSPSDHPITEVSGKPESLLLALWGRLSASEANLAIAGDPETAASIMAL